MTTGTHNQSPVSEFCSCLLEKCNHDSTNYTRSTAADAEPLKYDFVRVFSVMYLQVKVDRAYPDNDEVKKICIISPHFRCLR